MCAHTIILHKYPSFSTYFASQAMRTKFKELLHVVLHSTFLMELLVLAFLKQYRTIYRTIIFIG